ncbi:MAG TPA: hypothetical protein VGE39_24270 [Prosthecobacter sp.]
MKSAARLVMAFCFISLTGCGIQIPGFVHISWWGEGKGEEVKGTVQMSQKDGTTVQRRVSYWVSPNRSGATRTKAVRVVAYNMIEGNLAELHVLTTRFPKWRPSWGNVESIDFKTLFYTYHVYDIPMTDGTNRKFWFDANDYHGFF